MIGALWTGISGLAAHKTALDNESHNIANVNTVGYKAGRISFADQIYQDKIGKGTFVQDAEKLFEQGSMKLTGVEYDIALQGDGFFTVINKNTLGTAETFYTRAGNLRMGEAGTLETADGYKVQGWAMSKIDPKNDVVSTNQNISRFTDDFIKNAGSSIIRHKDYIETIAAKVTDFNETAKSDAVAIFSGAGQKTQASKLKDISLATDNYRNLLAKYQEDPNVISKGSTNQISQINFKTGLPPVSLIGKEGDSIEVTIDGQVYNQSFVLSKTTEDYRQKIWDDLSGSERGLHKLTEPNSIPALSDEDQQIAIAAYDKVAGKIETYKALADKISNSGNGGFVAYLAKNTSNPTSDILDIDAVYEQSTKISDMLQGVIQVEGLIPGKEFKITSVSEILGGSKQTVKGTFQSTSLASEGSGKAALDNSIETLARLVSGSQQNVYTTQDLYGSAGVPTLDRAYTFNINIFDRDLEEIIPVPNDGNTPPSAVPISIPAGSTIDEIVDIINNSTTTTGKQLGDYIVAKNLNGYLVLETNKSNYDIEFDAELKVLPTINLNSLIDNTSYEYSIKVNGQIISIDDAVMQIGNTIDSVKKKAIYDEVKNKIEAYNQANPGAKIEVTPLVNGTFSLVSKYALEGVLNVKDNDKADSINPTVAVVDPGASTVMFTKMVEVGNVTPGTTYSITIFGKTFQVTAGAGATSKTIRDSLLAQVSSDPNVNEYMSPRASGENGISFPQRKLFDPTGAGQGDIAIGVNNLAYSEPIAFVPGSASSVDINFDVFLTRSKSTLDITLAGKPTISISVETTDTDTNDTVYPKVMEAFAKYGTKVTDQFIITKTANGIRVTERRDEKGYHQDVNDSTVTASGQHLDYPKFGLESILIETNPDYSGRKGAGAEFMQITTRVDQLSTHDSLQLRLDKLDISDSKFGAFKVDETGLVTMNDGGVEFAVGQIAIARFTNNRGLEAVGDNNFRATQESGNVIYSINNNNTAGMQGKSLELSKADLSDSLVNLMVFQRAFEANAKSITTSDELLSTLINLKR